MYNSPMPSIRLEDLTPFGRAAVTLDREFAELARVGEQIARVDVESDGGLDQGVKLLNRAAQHGQSIADAMLEFSRSLQEARDASDAAMKAVSERAELIRQRRQREEELQRRLDQLKEDLTAAGAGLARSSPPAAGGLSDQDKRRIAAELEKLLEPMSRFIAAGRAIKDEAARSRFRRVERQADSIIDSLESSRRKLSQAIEPM